MATTNHAFYTDYANYANIYAIYEDCAGMDAAMAALYASKAAAMTTKKATADAGAKAAKAAVKAADLFSNANPRELINYLWTEYHLLAETAKREKWDDNTPVPPSFFDNLPIFVTQEHIPITN